MSADESLITFFGPAGITTVKPDEPLPVYSLSEFGEDVVFHFPLAPSNIVSGRVAEGNRTLIQGSELATGDQLSEDAAPGAVSTYDVTFDRLLDMAAWIYLLRPKIITQCVVGAGNTVTLAARVIITAVHGNLVRPLYDKTLTRAGVTVNEFTEFDFSFVGLETLMHQHEILRVEVILTSTRTAGAANTTIGLAVGNGLTRTSIYTHIHAHRKHANGVYGTDKTS